MNNKTVTENLKILLADSYTLYLKTQNYHWNVTGANFKSLHDLFQLQYEDLIIANDDIAERIRALGEKAPGSFAQFLKLTSIKEEMGTPSNSEMVKNLAKDQEIIIDSLKKSLKSAQNVEDEVTIGLIVDRMTIHEKNKWMLESSI